MEDGAPRKEQVEDATPTCTLGYSTPVLPLQVAGERERERERRREGEIILSSALSGTCARSEGALSKASDDIVDLELGGSWRWRRRKKRGKRRSRRSHHVYVLFNDIVPGFGSFCSMILYHNQF